MKHKPQTCLQAQQLHLLTSGIINLWTRQGVYSWHWAIGLGIFKTTQNICTRNVINLFIIGVKPKTRNMLLMTRRRTVVSQCSIFYNSSIINYGSERSGFESTSGKHAVLSSTSTGGRVRGKGTRATTRGRSLDRRSTWLPWQHRHTRHKRRQGHVTFRGPAGAQGHRSSTGCPLVGFNFHETKGKEFWGKWGRREHWTKDTRAMTGTGHKGKEGTQWWTRMVLLWGRGRR